MPRATPVSASTPAAAAPATSTASATAGVVKPPLSHASGNAVESAAGGGGGSALLEPLPPSSGKAAAKPKAGSSGPSLAMTGGQMATTLTLGVLVLATGLIGTAFARRRRALV